MKKRLSTLCVTPKSELHRVYQKSWVLPKINLWKKGTTGWQLVILGQYIAEASTSFKILIKIQLGLFVKGREIHI